MKFPTQFSPSSLYFFSLGSKHSSQQLVLTISVLRLEWENKIHVYIKKRKFIVLNKYLVTIKRIWIVAKLNSHIMSRIVRY
jgi:hypothetical protein